MLKNKINIFLGLILLAGLIIRLWGLGSAELMFDEGLYAFRSIGYLDYLESSTQTTPIQWLAPSLSSELTPTVPSGLADKPSLPFWLKLSFHDHPPLFFLTQHLFFKFFGDSLFVARLPSALAGTASIFLIFLIVSLIFKKIPIEQKNYPGKFPADKIAGLIAALIFSLTFSAVSISRLSMLESLMIFFILLNIYFFLRLLENKKYWFWFGLTLGLSFLTKYTAVFLVPAYFVFLLINRHHLLRDRRFYFSFLIAALIFSPVIIYNIFSYKTFGHFDLQLGYLLGQKLPWDTSLGGKTQDPFSNIFTNLSAIYSMPFLLLALIGLIISLTRPEIRQASQLMILIAIFITALLIGTGSAIRFVSLYIIPLTFFAAISIVVLIDKHKKIGLIFLSLFMAYELFFTVNLVFLNPPDYGVVKLDDYFDQVLDNKRGPDLPSHPNPHLNRVIQTYGARQPATSTSVGIIYDDNIATGPMLWLFSRRQYYHARPIMPASVFEEKIKTKNIADFKSFELYFVKGESASPLNPIRKIGSAEYIENFLWRQGLSPTTIIKTSAKAPAFKVYRFSLN